MSDEDVIKKYVIAFTKAMHQWEVDCAANSERAQLKDLRAIFRKYCTKRDRPQGRIHNLCYGVPGSYEYSKAMKVSACEKEKSGWAVFVSDESADERYRFKVKKTKAGFLIDSKKRFSRRKNKWVVDTL